MGNARAISKASLVTDAVTSPSPAVTVADRSKVQGPDGQVRIKPGTVGKPRAVADAVVRERMIIVFPTDDMLLIARMHKAVETMLAVMSRMPRVGQLARLRAQLGGIVPSEPCDQADDQPARERPLSPTEVSLLEHTFEALMVEARVDQVGVKMVVGRALRRPWKALAVEDPRRRNRAMLAFVRNNSLYRMARCPAGTQSLAALDKITLDRLDESAH